MKNGCNNCKNYNIGKMNMNKPDEPRSCKIGKNTEMEQWWKENGYKKSTDFLTDMECFEETELGQMCINASEILEELRRINNL